MNVNFISRDKKTEWHRFKNSAIPVKKIQHSDYMTFPIIFTFKSKRS